MSSPEYQYQKLKMDIAGLLAHWSKLANHIKQKPLARKVIQDLSKELQNVVDRD
jgi:hypothetical protein